MRKHYPTWEPGRHGYDVSVAATRSHAHRHRIRGFGYFQSLGPGIITGASDDPSGIGTYSQVGAAFRFDFLWTALFTWPLAAAV
jgi:Mn2+/Fe2+ NRAMP family transporter